MSYFAHLLRRRKTAAVFVAVIVFTVTGASAWAYWSTTGSGSASASTGTLNAPTNVAVSSAAGSGTVAVEWTASTGANAPQGYYVKRTSGGTSSFACGTSATSLKTAISCTDTLVPNGTYTYTVTAVFNSWTASSNPSSSLAVTTDVSTSTAVTSSVNPSVAGQTVTYTATVTPGSGTVTPTGSVTFKDDVSTVDCTAGTQTLNSSGVATCQTSYPDTGSHLITAAYGGVPGFSGSTSATLTQTVGRPNTTTALASSGSPSKAGQTVTYTATVAVVSPGAGTPTGTVVFKDGGTTITCSGGAQTLNGSGVATCSSSPSVVGTHSITAVYPGDSSYATSTSSALTQSVQQASTTTALVSSGSPSKAGQTVTYTATVAVVSPGGGTPTGTVVFKDGGTTITCSGGAQTLNGSGVATCSSSPSVVGTHSITAVYPGDSSYATSTSSALTQSVQQASTTTALVSSGSPSKAGQTVTYTATVAVVSPGGGTPTGTVVFKDGGTTITCSGGAQALNGSGVATCSSSPSVVGTHSITAVYPGDSSYATSTSMVLSQRVVSANVAGLAFANVKVNGSLASPTCSGVVGTTYTCTVIGAANNATVTANITFADAAGVAAVYSTEDQIVQTTQTGKTPGNGTVTVLGNQSTSSATASVQKAGSTGGSITVTFTDGGTRWTAVLQVN
jgi:hypothetical protein